MAISCPGSPVCTGLQWEDVRPLRDDLWWKTIKSLEALVLKGIITVTLRPQVVPTKEGAIKRVSLILELLRLPLLVSDLSIQALL